jgi:hypothetical protein
MDLQTLADNLKATGDIAAWEAGMRQYLREQYEAAMTLVKGGRDNITQADWGYEGSLLKKQYQYLSNFANDIAKNPDAWLNTNRLNARMDLYKESAYSAMEDMRRREYTEAGYTEERRLLHAAESCPGCLSQAGLGWQPIGSLDPIGAEECVTNCKCEFDFRKAEGASIIQQEAIP